MAKWRFFLAFFTAAWLSVPVASAGGIDPQATAQRVDELLAGEAFGGAAPAPADAVAAKEPAEKAAAENVAVAKPVGAHAPAAKADDQTLLRRLTLDLIGQAPTPAEITAFTLNSAPDKRAAAVERLLASPQFGDNWARYWRDVIMYRRSEERALLASGAVVEFLAKEFNGDPHWDQIARKFITATGDVTEEGATAIIMAQMANAEDTTAEISRIFLGIQIQCAQCHNHPTDRWKREQFHELAAFFPRIAVRPVRDADKGKRRSFEVVSIDRGPKVKKADKPNRGSLEHYMPDLDHPEAEGKLMKPVFFVTGQKLDTGLTDQERRTLAAEWITARKDRWFAKAFVNRLWSELVGRGFYEPVDDIGPDRACSAPHTLDFLADRFAASQYDVKWLFRVITATEAYARSSRSRYDESGAPFAASCPQRLRADQLYNTLATILGLDDDRQGEAKRADYRRPFATPRGRVNLAFGYDPSVRRDEVAGSIPQALFLMNGPELNRALSARGPNTMLGKLLAEIDKDDAVVEELYLRCLAREPHDEEVETCLEYVKSIGNRGEAFEDIAWSLVNSTEFLNRK
ncbi:MAG: DUF1549 domain-containing protein [Pirellulales bacterium]